MLFLLSTFGSKGTKEADPALRCTRHFVKAKEDIENTKDMDLRLFHIFPPRRERGMTNKTFLLTSWIIMGNLRQEGIVERGLQWKQKAGKT